MAWAAGDLYNGSAVLKAECSGSSEYSATYPATKAFDAITAVDVDNCWISSDSNTPEVDGSCYLEWDFTQRMFISGLQLQRRDSTAGQITNYPKDIVVKAKKDEDTGWTTVKTVSLASPADGAWGAEVPFDPIYAGHYDSLRIEFHSVHYRGVVGWNVCVKEVRFLGRASAGACPVALRGDVKGTFVQEVSGTNADRGYVGATVPNETFAMQFREHDRYAGNSSTQFQVLADYFKQSTYTYSDECAGYIQAVFPKTAIDGLYLSFKLYTKYTIRTDAYIRVHDGAFDYASTVDYPTDAAPVTKGAGVLQTIYSVTTDVGSPTVVGGAFLDLSAATEENVTIRVEMLKNGMDGTTTEQFLYYLNLSSIDIQEAARGVATLPMMPLLGNAVDFSGDVSLPTFSIVAVCEGAYGSVDLPAPRPEQVTNIGDAVLPLGLTAEGYIPLLGEAWLPTPEMSGLMGGRGVAELPLESILGEGAIGLVGNGAVDLPAPLVGGFDGAWGRMSATFSMVGSGAVSALARGSVELPLVSIVAAGSAAQMAMGRACLPAPIPAGRSVSGGISAAGSIRARLILAGVGHAGITCAGAVDLPLCLTGAGSISALGVGDAELPLPVMCAAALPVPAQAGGLLRFHRGF